ncbi:MAG: hypothetical protein KC592_17415 [Nitrospira sp.]|nr:hypothetical protein [Nitrospira sp.]HNP27768.1 hypothetical protein [Nitrospirales bacterium]
MGRIPYEPSKSSQAFSGDSPEVRILMVKDDPDDQEIFNTRLDPLGYG